MGNFHTMSFLGGGGGGGRRRLRRRRFMLCFFILLIISVCSDNYKVGAIRIFPSENWASQDHHHHQQQYYSTMISEKKKIIDHEDMFKKVKDYEYNRSKKNIGAGPGGFEDSKRKVPSCPDPLHN